MLFAGIVFGLFKAIELMPVPIAILTYFVYPLLTGIIGALLGIDKLTLARRRRRRRRVLSAWP